MEERIPPQDMEAEQSVLGAMMLSKEAIAAVLDKIKPDDYYRDGHKFIFEAMIALYQRNEPIDLVTVSAELNKQDKLDGAGGKTYLIDVVNSVPTAANVEHYAGIVREKSILRRLIDTGTHIVSDSFDDNLEVDMILGDAQREIMEISKDTSGDEFARLGTVVESVWDQISESYGTDDQILGVPTGFKDLDQMTSGFQPSELIILAARPSMGKTTLAMNFAVNAAFNHGKTVAVFSLEMPKEQLALRMLSSEAKVDMARLKTANIHENEYKGIAKALGKLSEANIYIDDTPGISPLAMRAKLRRLEMEGPIDLVLIDYLQLMRIGKKKIESRFQEVSEIVREVKGLAKEVNVPIIALSQLSRDVEKRGGDTIPKLSDLRESGELEQTADLVMFIHREDYYDGTNSNKTSLTNLIISKQRNGPTGRVELVFRKDVSRFEMASSVMPAKSPQSTP
ncbi:replicative DNA helicase [bacterium]|jgi:replicative DNA helicase|nr:replicative DNA helicase [bacterium]